VLVTHNEELASMMQAKYKIDDGVLIQIWKRKYYLFYIFYWFLL
jgi:ABC-type lipoprotein export system ATPase subunit